MWDKKNSQSANTTRKATVNMEPSATKIKATLYAKKESAEKVNAKKGTQGHANILQETTLANRKIVHMLTMNKEN